MKFWFHLGSLFFVAASVFSEEESRETTVLSLQDVFLQVEQANLSVLSAREQITESRESLRQQRAPLLPELDLTASQRRSNSLFQPGGSRVLPESNEANVDRQTGGAVNTFNAGLEANWRLFDVNRIADFRLARLDIDLSELSFDATLQDRLASAGLIFFQHQRNVSGLKVIESNIRRAKGLLELAQNQFRSGLATEIDVIRARSILASERRLERQQKTTVLESALRLEQLLGRSPTGSLILSEFETSDLDGILSVIPEGLQLLSQNPAYQREKTLQSQNQLARRAAGLQRLPTVQAFGDYGIRSELPFDGDDQRSWAAGLSVSVPIFEGLRMQADRRRADSRIRRQELILQELENNILSDSFLFREDAVGRFEQITFAEEQRDLARDELRLAQRRFSEGITDNRDVIEAQNNLARAEDTLVEAKFRYQVAVLEIARLSGEVRIILQY